MTNAIQHACYLEAHNASDREILIELAGEPGADTDAFAQTLDAPAPDNGAELQREIETVRVMDF
jgi:predicted DsbA family dithiol-disulfide isomerase